jgi:hypothetical protein
LCSIARLQGRETRYLSNMPNQGHRTPWPDEIVGESYWS